MTNPNSYPSQTEQDTFRDQVIVQYNDGACALKFQTHGDRLELGYDSPLTYAQGFLGDSHNMALIKTKSGNTYGLAKGVIINFGTKRGYAMPIELPAVVIGKPWSYNPQDGAHTSDVESVSFRYKYAPQGYGDEQVDKPDPFRVLEHNVDLIRDINPQI